MSTRTRVGLASALTLGVLAGGASVIGQQSQAAPPDHAHDAMQSRGEQVMGFDQTKSAHHFLLHPDGGSIVVQVKDASDEAGIQAIRRHLSQVAMAFSNGDFSMPQAIHQPGGSATAGHGAEPAHAGHEAMHGTAAGATQNSAMHAAMHAAMHGQAGTHATTGQTGATHAGHAVAGSSLMHGMHVTTSHGAGHETTGAHAAAPGASAEHTTPSAVPGTAAMARFKTEIRYDYTPTPLGAVVSITATRAEALAAVHEFLRYQIAEHRTGDSGNVRQR